METSCCGGKELSCMDTNFAMPCHLALGQGAKSSPGLILFTNTDRGYDTQRENTLSDVRQALRDTETRVQFFLFLLLLLFFLFLVSQVAFAFWLQLYLFLRTEAKKVFGALVCSVSSSVIKGCL